MAYSKYKNKKTEVDGITFDSRKEALRWMDLKLLRQGGVIKDLELQPAFDIVVNGTKVCRYRADFRYVEDGAVVVEDVKGMRTPIYNLKKKLMRAVLGIDIRET